MRAQFHGGTNGILGLDLTLAMPFPTRWSGSAATSLWTAPSHASLDSITNHMPRGAPHFAPAQPPR